MQRWNDGKACFTGRTDGIAGNAIRIASRELEKSLLPLTRVRSVILFPSDFFLSLPFFSNIPSKFARFRTRITRGIIIIKTRTVKELNKSTTNKTPIHVYLLLENSKKTRENEEHRGERSVRFFLLPPAGRAIGGEGRGSGGKERRNGVKSFLEYRRGMHEFGRASRHRVGSRDHRQRSQFHLDVRPH